MRLLRLVRKSFRSHLDYVSSHAEEFALSPRFFSRARKCPLKKLLSVIFQMTRGNIPDAIFSSLLPKEKELPFSASAFIQQRNKLLVKAIRYIFIHVLQNLLRAIKIKLYHGYHLLACDGSDFPMPSELTPSEPEADPHRKVQHTLLHLNGLYDVQNHFYVAVSMKDKLHCSERVELLSLVDELYRGSGLYPPDKSIVICDMGYESYHIFTRLILGRTNFVIRVQGIGQNGILSGLALPSPQGKRTMDVCVKVHVRKNSQGLYKRCYSTKFDPSRDEVISLRIVTKRLSNGEFEYLVTNLPREKFTKGQIAFIYQKRWNIETSFRHLKYSIGGVIFHSQKPEHQMMELYASLTLFNCISCIVNHTTLSRNGRQYPYKVSFSASVDKCIYFLLKGDDGFDLEGWLKACTVPIRPGRKFDRNLRPGAAKGFQYRNY